MALPPAVNYPAPAKFGYNWGMSDVNLRMTLEDAERFSASYTALTYLGHGSDGIAYSHGNPNTVIKISTSDEEGLTAEALVGKRHACCAKVHSVHQNEEAGIWIIEVEKLTLLTPAQARVINHKLCGTAEAKELSEKYRRMVACLKKIGVDMPDAHSNNVGFKRNGELALFDFGPNANLV